ncbi:MAG: ABC transporter substrate-binding protein [Gammaproteobacteria bacterium]|nr:ABC transporter substrate-binding protein [Gammaproteobacteria bacterium]
MIAGLAALCLGSPAAHAAESSPQATVEKLHSALLETMRDGKSLGYKGRASKLEPVLRDAFDFAGIARLVTGRYWAKLDKAKQQAFIAVFTQLSIATYADNFSSFGNERFETRGVEDKKNAQLVKTAIVKPDGKEDTLDYALGKSADGWRIINVVADGVSDLSLKRAEYTAVIGSNGIDTLIAKLNAKVASYEAANK